MYCSSSVFIPLENELANRVLTCLLYTSGNKKKYESGKEGLDEVERNLVREAKFMLASYGTLSTPEPVSYTHLLCNSWENYFVT